MWLWDLFNLWQYIKFKIQLIFLILLIFKNYKLLKIVKLIFLNLIVYIFIKS